MDTNQFISNLFSCVIDIKLFIFHLYGITTERTKTNQTFS